MLVLTRKLQEKIRIGDHVTITVLRMKGKAVRLGIEAPTDVPVIRGELAFAESPSAKADKADAATGTASRAARSEPDWVTDTHPRLPVDKSRGTGPKSEVCFARVPRDKAAAAVAPLTTGSGGPLRAMLDRRTVNS